MIANAIPATLVSESNYNLNLDEYYAKMEIIIRNIMLRPEKNTLTYDILDTEKCI